MKTKTYGCRGSIAVSQFGESRYGANTSCMTIESQGVGIIFDAGSGLMMLEKELAPVPNHILISHLHIDHIIGLGMFTPMWTKNSRMRVYTCSRDDRPLRDQIFGAFVPPYWPASLAKNSGAQCIGIEAGVPFNIGHIKVTPFLANHPDKTLSFHVDDGEKIFIHLLDHEIVGMSDKAYQDLINICAGADMVVFDSAYSSEDYPALQGRGHSTVEQGVALAKACKPKRMMFSHYGWQYSDKQLDTWEMLVAKETCCEFIFAYDGLEMTF